MAETKTINKMTCCIWHLVAGLIMVALGVYIWFNPAVTLVALALYLGVVFIIVGAGYISFSFSYKSGWYLLVGIIDILVGVIFVANLGLTAASMPIIFALWCLAVGIIQIYAGLTLKKLELPWIWSISAGALGILFGVLILAYPALGTFTLTALMGAYILLYGMVEVAEYVYRRQIIAQ